MCSARRSAKEIRRCRILSLQSTDERIYDIRTRALKELVRFVLLLFFALKNEVNLLSMRTTLGHVRGQKSGSHFGSQGLGALCDGLPVVWWLLCFDCLRSTIPPSSVAIFA